MRSTSAIVSATYSVARVESLIAFKLQFQVGLFLAAQLLRFGLHQHSGPLPFKRLRMQRSPPDKVDEVGDLGESFFRQAPEPLDDQLLIGLCCHTLLPRALLRATFS